MVHHLDNLFLVKSFKTVLALLLLSSAIAFAEDEAAEEGEEGAEAPAPAIYLPLKPAFVVNYGGAGKLKYIKAELTVRLKNADAANAVRYHMPFVRNNLVMLFAAQTNESLSSQDGKEKLRADALLEIRKVVEEEEGMPAEDVVEVFFNTFIVQK